MLRVGTHLSNIQKELLKLYSTDLPDQQLHEIKLLLGQYFAHKASTAMDKFLEENNLGEQDLINWTNEHTRGKSSH
jgi:hypothetical protein